MEDITNKNNKYDSDIQYKNDNLVVCTNCWEYPYYNKCNCPKDKKRYVEIDGDIADVIISLNKAFIKLGWNLRTEYCCAGHLEGDDRYNRPYILFIGNPIYFHHFIYKYEFFNEKLAGYPVTFETRMGQYNGQYRLTIEVDFHAHVFESFKDKINFLKVRTIFIECLGELVSYFDGLKAIPEK